MGPDGLTTKFTDTLKVLLDKAEAQISSDKAVFEVLCHKPAVVLQENYDEVSGSSTKGTAPKNNKPNY